MSKCMHLMLIKNPFHFWNIQQVSNLITNPLICFNNLRTFVEFCYIDMGFALISMMKPRFQCIRESRSYYFDKNQIVKGVRSFKRYGISKPQKEILTFHARSELTEMAISFQGDLLASVSYRISKTKNSPRSFLTFFQH